jgi:hypothetical protein
MRLMFALVTCLFACHGTQALSAEPQEQTSSSVKSQPAAAATAAPAATVASSSSPAQATSAAAPPANSSKALSDAEKKLRSQGYKPEVHNGNTVYCRKETQLGSHFESKTCGSPEQIVRAQQDSKETLEKIQREERGPVSN